MTKTDPSVLYQAAVNDAGATVVDDLAKQQGVNRAEFMSKVAEYCMLNGRALPKLKLMRDEAPVRRGSLKGDVINRKDGMTKLQISALRIELLGFKDVVNWQAATVAPGTVVTIQEKGKPVAVSLPKGAMLIYPANELDDATHTAPFVPVAAAQPSLPDPLPVATPRELTMEVTIEDVTARPAAPDGTVLAELEQQLTGMFQQATPEATAPSSEPEADIPFEGNRLVHALERSGLVA